METKKSHFRPIPGLKKRCNHPEHKPPMFLHIPQGQEYVHVCPSCGKETVVRPQQYTLGTK